VNVLLDTHAFLWLITNDPALSNHARSRIASPDNAVYLSAVSTWEIAVKHRIGRLPLPDRPDRYIARQRALHAVDALALDEAATLHEPLLPPIHRDPFDRMLVCQALVHGMTILTADRAIQDYPVRTEW